MKLFQIDWLDGKKQLVGAEDYETVPKEAGIRGGAIRAIDCIREVPSKSMAEIAHELGLPLCATVFFFRGLFSKPWLGQGLFEAKDVDTEKNLVPMDDAVTFIERVNAHLAQATT